MSKIKLPNIIWNNIIIFGKRENIGVYNNLKKQSDENLDYKDKMNSNISDREALEVELELELSDYALGIIKKMAVEVAASNIISKHNDLFTEKELEDFINKMIVVLRLSHSAIDKRKLYYDDLKKKNKEAVENYGRNNFDNYQELADYKKLVKDTLEEDKTVSMTKEEWNYVLKGNEFLNSDQTNLWDRIEYNVKYSAVDDDGNIPIVLNYKEFELVRDFTIKELRSLPPIRITEAMISIGEKLSIKYKGNYIWSKIYPEVPEIKLKKKSLDKILGDMGITLDTGGQGVTVINGDSQEFKDLIEDISNKN